MKYFKPATKKVSLAEVHEWILKAREILETDEGMLSYLDIFVIPDEDTPTEDVLQVATDFRAVLHHVAMLDNLFHDKFDCR